MNKDRIYSMLTSPDTGMRVLAITTLVRMGRDECVLFFDKYGQYTPVMDYKVHKTLTKHVIDHDIWSEPPVFVRGKDVCVASFGISWVCHGMPSGWGVDGDLIIDV